MKQKNIKIWLKSYTEEKIEMAEIMEKEISVSYDEENDILLLRRSDQQYAGSIEIGDFIIDLSRDMQTVVAVEILNASKVLTSVFGMDIDAKMLGSVKTATLRAANKGDAVYIYYGIIVPQIGEKPLTSMIPIPQPVEAV